MMNLLFFRNLIIINSMAREQEMLKLKKLLKKSMSYLYTDTLNTFKTSNIKCLSIFIIFLKCSLNFTIKVERCIWMQCIQVWISEFGSRENFILFNTDGIVFSLNFSRKSFSGEESLKVSLVFSLHYWTTVFI